MSLPLPAPECSIYYPELDNSPGIIINPKRKSLKGFTLIELSIVLVIIGLIVGGILVGQDLIAAAGIRAQIAQIDKYQSAVNTFRGKYNYIPGDIPDPDASRFGFLQRGTGEGHGDGNGVIEGLQGGAGPSGKAYLDGENGAFWVDLSTANLIDGGFHTANPTTIGVLCPATQLSLYIPQAKIGRGNWVYVDSGDVNNTLNPYNYFGISAVIEIGVPNVWEMYSNPGLTVKEAYNIDKKMDDGLPQSGKVLAYYYNYPYSNNKYIWATGDNTGVNPGTAKSPSSGSCGDNGGDGTKPQQYSLSYNNGTGVNCALHFQFQ